MRTPKILIPVLLLAITASCSNLFNNDSGPELTIQTSQSSKSTTFNGDTLIFRKYDTSDAPDKYVPFKSTQSDKQIIIEGYYLAPSGFMLSGSIDRENQNINVLIKRNQAHDTFVTQPTAYLYKAYISNLEGEQYTVKIRHQDDLMRAPDQKQHVVFDETFELK